MYTCQCCKVETLFNCRSAAQSLLDEILGPQINSDKKESDSGFPRDSVIDPLRKNSVIGCCNGKMFASPPRRDFIRQDSKLSSTQDHNTQPTQDKSAPPESFTNNLMDVTGMFEPSQRANISSDCDSDCTLFEVPVSNDASNEGSLTGKNHLCCKNDCVKNFCIVGCQVLARFQCYI